MNHRGKRALKFDVKALLEGEGAHSLQAARFLDNAVHLRNKLRLARGGG